MPATPTRADVLGALDRDDIVLPFKTERSGIKGRLVRLGSSIDTILGRHAYPEVVSELLGHAIGLTAMLGSGIGPDATLALQTKSDGPVGFLFVDFEASGRLRAYASFSRERVGELAGGGQRPHQGSLIGRGHMALTIDPGGGGERTQGIVALENDSLTSAALTYFRRSENLPTYIRLAVAKELVAGSGQANSAWRWRAGGLIVQDPTRPSPAPAPEESSQSGDGEDWTRVRLLAATVEDHELIDRMLSPERLLMRLFHEEGVRLYAPKPVSAHCRCSRDKVEAFLKSFGSEALADLREPDGGLSVTCEFCRTVYRFQMSEFV